MRRWRQRCASFCLLFGLGVLFSTRWLFKDLNLQLHGRPAFFYSRLVVIHSIDRDSAERRNGPSLYLPCSSGGFSFFFEWQSLPSNIVGTCRTAALRVRIGLHHTGPGGGGGKCRIYVRIGDMTKRGRGGWGGGTLAHSFPPPLFGASLFYCVVSSIDRVVLCCLPACPRLV